MSNLSYTLATGGRLGLDLFTEPPGTRPDGGPWLAVTMLLALAVLSGCAVIAVNWYFQRKLARQSDSRAALRRMCVVAAGCGTLGVVFTVWDAPWVCWRVYDVVLALLALDLWSFVHRHRGLGLVDERLKQVAELERTATRYREIAELLPHMVWTANAHGHVDFANQRWHEYAGGERTWLEAVHPDDSGRVLSAWNAAVTSRVPVSFEARLDGGARAGYRAFAVKATPIVQGEALKWLGACADIEDQKLLAAEKDAQARQKSFFLNALSHDLRAPLHNVLLNAQLLKMSQQAGEPLDVEAVEMIRENAVAAGDLVARLLDFAKVGAQEQNVLERVALPHLLHQIARRFMPVAEQKGLNVRVIESAANHNNGDGNESIDAHVLTDRQKLERIISNLIDNAIKYTRSGSVTLELLATAGEGDENVRVRVRDSGIGIPTDKVPYLFDEFYQVNNYERDRSKGFGMGLAICRSLARHIGADVRLAATGAEGSCFEIVIPRGRGDQGGRDSTVVGAVPLTCGTLEYERQRGIGGHGGNGRQGVGADRRGRPHGAASDRDDPATAGVCGA
jgi:signal transduction histidine kinase